MLPFTVASLEKLGRPASGLGMNVPLCEGLGICVVNYHQTGDSVTLRTI